MGEPKYPLGRLLRKARSDKNLSLSQVAQQLSAAGYLDKSGRTINGSGAVVGSWELGMTFPNFDELPLIARTLSIPANELDEKYRESVALHSQDKVPRRAS